MTNRIQQLAQLGQSVWLDNIQRKMITSGKLKAMINEGLLGMTSNPTIFEKAIVGTTDYDDALQKLIDDGYDATAIYDALTIEDVGMAADVFRPVYERTNGGDGYVSIEVSPKLAHDTQRTLDDARRLWHTLKRPNVMVKIPATKESLPAIEQALIDGININVTLMFSMDHYVAVAEAYLRALEARAAAGKRVDHIASVASFFVSRVDTLLDGRLEKIADVARLRGALSASNLASSLLGKAAVANSQLVYERFRQIIADERFKALEAKGARVQRVLWASTSTKNPRYPDTLYVDTLIGPDTINTVPPETYTAILDHATVQCTVDTDLDRARQVVADLKSLGFDLNVAGEQLSVEGVDKFTKSFEGLLSVIDDKRIALMAQHTRHGEAQLGAQQGEVERALTELDQDRTGQRVWNNDAGVWSKEEAHVKEILNRLGWLTVIDEMKDQVDDLRTFAAEVRAAGFTDVVVLGMGGSSLGPDVARITFGSAKGYPQLHVLDTTNPASIIALEKQITLTKTLFIVASKSGTTSEIEALHRYFRARLRLKLGDDYGGHFIAITDPGTPLEDVARADRFRRVFVNPSDIGGRYSVLSYFGLVPMALSGIDIAALLDRARAMAKACGPTVTAAANPGVWLGAIMGVLARAGRDKLTFITSKKIASFGYWVEQLIAESTGKVGRGIVPIDGEAPGDPKVYGDDRLFVVLRLMGDKALEAKVKALADAGQPIVTIELADLYDLGAEFFRWEMATVIAGAMLQLDPLDQPNVTESKNNTKNLLDQYQSTRKLPEGDRVLAPNTKAVNTAVSDLLKQVRPGDYVALMAYLPPSPATDKALQQIRTTLRDRLKVATTIGYGPRFLHSTGQLHKGGANKGVFVQITADDARDLPIDGRPYSFGVLLRAQAIGDLQALQGRRYRVVRIHLGKNVATGLKTLQSAVETAVGVRKKRAARRPIKTPAKRASSKPATKRRPVKKATRKKVVR
jgi:transaldolase/glucose-6-phosphate isomerase